MDDACQQIVSLAPSLDLMMSPGRLSLHSSYRTLIFQRLLRGTARNKIQTSVAWAKPPIEKERKGGKRKGKTGRKKGETGRGKGEGGRGKGEEINDLKTCSKKFPAFHATAAIRTPSPPPLKEKENKQKKKNTSLRDVGKIGHCRYIYMLKHILLAPVVQRVNNAIQRTTIGKTNYAIR